MLSYFIPTSAFPSPGEMPEISNAAVSWTQGVDHNDTWLTSESQCNKIKSCSVSVKPAISISTKYHNETVAVR